LLSNQQHTSKNGLWEGDTLELEVINLNVRIDGKNVLQGISFKISESECLGVVGPNGSGKTTLLQSIIGLHNGSGTVSFDGRDIHEMDLCREGIYYVPDNGSFFDMTVRENLEFFYRCYSKNDAVKMESDIDSILGAVRLMGHANSPAYELSRGMKRRLAYAMTMVSVPSVLIMDDPFANLDTDGRLYLEGYLRTLKILGTTLLIGSNDLMDLQEVCDSVVLLRGGCIKDRIKIEEGLDLRERYLESIRGR